MLGKPTIAGLLLLFVASLLFAQEPPPMPQPGPEHQRLHYFVGEWRSESELKPGPMGPGGKFSSNDHNEMLGDFFLTLHSEGKGAMGDFKDVAVMGYDSRQKTYTYDGFSSMGEHTVSKGSVSGKNWTWIGDMEMGEKKVKGRFSMTEVSPTSYTFKFDTSEDGKAWTNVMEGKSTKMQ